MTRGHLAPLILSVDQRGRESSRRKLRQLRQTGDDEVHDEVPELLVGGVGVALVQEHGDEVGAQRFGFGAAGGLERAPFGPDNVLGKVVHYLEM